MSQNADLVSIIVPAYNAARFIKDTINSVIDQTHQNWEILIVNDCSKDSTLEIITDLARREPRIRIFNHDRNSGVATARNTALNAARSSLVAFLDSDDTWLPNKLTTQLNGMTDLGYGFTFTAFRRITADGAKIGALRSVPSMLTYQKLLKNTAIVTSSVVINRDITGDFRMPSVDHEDFATWLSILKRGNVAHGINMDLVRYRIAPRSLSRNKARSAKWIWQVYRDSEHLSLAHSTWCFVNYAIRGFMKYRSL